MDDDPDILEATRTVLDRWGGEVRCLDSAETFLDTAEGQPVHDIVLMDYRLNDQTDGLDLLHHYRARHGEGFLGVLITAEQDPAVERTALEAGFQFLAKPVEPAKLRSILHAAMLEQERARVVG